MSKLTPSGPVKLAPFLCRRAECHLYPEPSCTPAPLQKIEDDESHEGDSQEKVEDGHGDNETPSNIEQTRKQPPRIRE